MIAIATSLLLSIAATAAVACKHRLPAAAAAAAAGEDFLFS